MQNIESEEVSMKSSGTAIDRVKTARHLERPYALDIIERIFEEFVASVTDLL